MSSDGQGTKFDEAPTAHAIVAQAQMKHAWRRVGELDRAALSATSPGEKRQAWEAHDAAQAAIHAYEKQVLTAPVKTDSDAIATSVMLSSFLGLSEDGAVSVACKNLTAYLMERFSISAEAIGLDDYWTASPPQKGTDAGNAPRALDQDLTATPPAAFKDDLTPVNFEDLTPGEQRGVAEMLAQSAERKRRATILHSKLLRLQPSAAQHFRADRLITQWDEPELRALEDLVELLPGMSAMAGA